MAGFDINDLYTVSAGVLLSDYWNPFVTKHDTSSFYNWEQDNLPLYDLEERTDYLWEKLGWPTSSLPGMVLAVSSSIPSHLDVSCNFFLDVSSAIKALPEVLHMPVMIEVCTSGNLGDLCLDNIKCTQNGALEIVNRTGVRIIGAPNDATVPSDFSALVYALNPGSEYGVPLDISSIDMNNVISDTSCLLASSNNVEFIGQADTGGTARGFAQIRQGFYSNNAFVSNFLVESVMDKQLTASNTTRLFPIGNRHTAAGVTDYTTTESDVSAINRHNGDIVRRSKATANDNTCVHGFTTSNFLRRLSIKNCDGPIYIRGFIVDPAELQNATPYTSYSHEYLEGAAIDNSSRVTLENFGVMRGRGTGLLVNNSNVNLRRGFASSRNYTAPASDTRGESYGLKAYNSTLNVVTDTYVSGSEYFFNIQGNDVGAYLHNSVLTGGDGFAETIVGHPSPTVLNFFMNGKGIEAVNSEISVKGLITAYSNSKGIEATNSTLYIDGICCEANQNEGLHLINSHLKYSVEQARQSTLNQFDKAAGVDEYSHTPWTYQMSFASNGQHLKMESSTFKLDDVDTNYVDTAPLIYFANHIGTDSSSVEGTNLSQAVVLKNSYAQFCNTRMFAPRANTAAAIFQPTIYTQRTVNGCLVHADRASTVDFHGTSYGATQLVGPDQPNFQRRCVGVVANNNSTVNFMGPTFIGQLSVDALADNNSAIKFMPHQDHEGALNINDWSLSSKANHTSVELHATRSCLVANRGSEITMRDLGDYHATWDRDLIKASVSSADYGTGDEGQGYDSSGYFASGCMIMLPNPDDTANPLSSTFSLTENYSNKTNPEASPNTHRAFAAHTAIGTYSGAFASFLGVDYATINETDFQDKLSTGGFCVRVMNGSRVNIRNVNFIPGPVNADKEYYDPSHDDNNAGCYNLRIWNIGDGSHMDSAYCSVSGVYPSLADYYGPRGVWQKPGTTWYTGQGTANASAVGQTGFKGLNYGTSDGWNDGTDIQYEYDDTYGNNSILDSYGDWVPLKDTTINKGLVADNAIGLAKYYYLVNNSDTSPDYSGGGELFDPAKNQGEDANGDVSAHTWYGMNGASGPYNRGPFRIYYSTNPASNLLFLSGTDNESNIVTQVFAQGYHASGPCSAVSDDIATLIAADLFMVSGSVRNEEKLGANLNGRWDFSGYYHVKDFVDPSFVNRVRIDESASNTFANAKHCSRKVGGRPPLLSIYRATTGEDGEGRSNDTNGTGRGFRSANIFDFDRRN